MSMPNVFLHSGAGHFFQVQDMVNKIDDGSGVLDFEDFLLVMILDQCV